MQTQLNMNMTNDKVMTIVLDIDQIPIDIHISTYWLK
jgi:hypothetical protein